MHKGLGEMQTLAVGVGDLKRVLTNVKSRGTWGEVQLGMLLAEVLVPQQYEANVETRPGSNKRVEYAIRLPGRSADGAPVLAAGRRQVSARGLAAAAGRAGARRRAGRGDRAQGPRRLHARAGEDHSRAVRRAAAHDRLRDPVRAGREPVRRDDVPGPGFAGISCSASFA